MFGKVKKWLGIEGVKVEILVPEVIPAKSKTIQGKLRFESMNDQTVTSIKVSLIEKYSRGRGKDRLVDEYELGSIRQKKSFTVAADTPLEIDFSLPFEMLQSDVDRIQGKNILYGGVARAAKMIRSVKSEFRMEAEATVKGVALPPFAKKIVRIK